MNLTDKLQYHCAPADGRVSKHYSTKELPNKMLPLTYETDCVERL